MKKLLQTMLVSAVLATSGFSQTSTIDGTMTWAPGSNPTITNGGTTTITRGTVNNYANFVIKDYSTGNAATIILDETSAPPGAFENKAQLAVLSETSQVVKDAGYDENEYNIDLGSVGSGISFQDKSGTSVTVNPTDLSFSLPSDQWYHGSTGRILNIVSANPAIELETVKLNGQLYATLATLKIDDVTYLPKNIELNTGGLSGDFEYVTVPVTIKSSTNSLFMETLSSNFPNADVTIADGVSVMLGTDKPLNFVINKSLKLGNNSTLKINNEQSLTLSPGATLTI